MKALTRPQVAALRAMLVAPAPVTMVARNRDHQVAGTTMSALQPMGLAVKVRIGRRWYGDITEKGRTALARVLGAAMVAP